MIPLLLLIGGAVILLGPHFGKEFATFAKDRVSGQRSKPVVFQTQPHVFKRENPYTYALLATLKQGREPDDWLINEAMCEAYDRGNWALVAKLQRRFGDLELDESEESEDGDSEEESEDEGTEQPDTPTIVVGKASPFDGVPDDAWGLFVSRLETQKPEYEGPKHVGRFHHSRERLSELNITDVSTADRQYDALVKDLTDSREKSDALIKSFECQPIALKDGEHLITLSGILAVVKSAGLDNARSWFDNPDDRTKFPKTTEMFLKANGVF